MVRKRLSVLGADREALERGASAGAVATIVAAILGALIAGIFTFAAETLRRQAIVPAS